MAARRMPRPIALRARVAPIVGSTPDRGEQRPLADGRRRAGPSPMAPRRSAGQRVSTRCKDPIVAGAGECAHGA
jgi:hypothetical protein